MKTRKESKFVAIEVIPPPARLREASADLNQLVQQEVAKLLTARDEFIFEPFFRSRQVAVEIRRIQTVSEQRKWGVFYEQEGCLRCHKSELPHAACGLCHKCHSQVAEILKRIVKRGAADK